MRNYSYHLFGGGSGGASANDICGSYTKGMTFYGCCRGTICFPFMERDVQQYFHVFTHIYTHIQTDTCTHIQTHTCTHMHTHTNTHMHTHIQTYTCTHTYKHKHVHNPSTTVTHSLTPQLLTPTPLCFTTCVLACIHSQLFEICFWEITIYQCSKFS